MLQLKQLEKEQMKLKVRNHKDQSINKWNRDRNNRKKISETKSWFYEKINEIDKTRIFKENREWPQINEIENEKGEVTVNTKAMQSIIRNYNKQLYANKMENIIKMDKYLERYSLLRLKQD